MPKQLFGVHIMHPRDVQSEAFNDALKKAEQEPMTFFEDGVVALKYGCKIAKLCSTQVTQTPTGLDAKCERLPSAVFVYRMLCNKDTLPGMQPTTAKEMPYVNSYVGLLNKNDVREQKVILPSDTLNKMGTYEITEAQSELAKRWSAFSELDNALSNTPKSFLSALNLEFIQPVLSKMYGDDGLIANDFITPYDVEKPYNKVMKTLWENNAGLHYISQMERLHNDYKTCYALCVVYEEMPMEKAAATAAIEMINEFKKIASKYGDVAMQNVLDELAEDIVTECGLREEIDSDER